MSEQTTTVRTDELRPGDRIWHPFDIVCFTVAHKPEPVALDFEGERGLRVTGTDDRGETVHVDVAPAYKWHRAPKATAPTTHAPLVVNTRDGICWTRRVVTSGGIALYAPESVRTCPDFVMATEAELAELGIVGSADALPMPVREEPRDLAASFDRDETADERQARWEKAAWTAGRTVDRNTLGVYMAVADAEQQKLADDWARSVTSSDAELKRLRARVAELEAAAKDTGVAADVMPDRPLHPPDRLYFPSARLHRPPTRWLLLMT